MNLQSWFNNVAATKKNVAARTGFFRQIRRDGLSCARRMKLLSVRARSFAIAIASVSALAVAFQVSAQTNYYGANGFEYPIVGSLAGDQMFPDVAISATNGFVVWQDNATDGDGWGISARRLDSTLSGTLGTFRVNSIGAGDQENPRVALLKKGGAAFVWQGGVEGYQHIYARFLTPTNTFFSVSDLLVSTFSRTNSFQVNPALAVLNNSNVVVTWASFNQAGSNSLFDVYAKILSPTGAVVVAEFLVNQFTNYNQRSPSVAALNNGGFVVTWVSEQQQQSVPVLGTNTYGVFPSAYAAGSALVPSVNIYARLYRSNGVPVGPEFRVDTASEPCANPSVAAASDGSFAVAWSGRDLVDITNGWDVFARPFSSAGVGGTTIMLNTYTYGNQYAPRLSVLGLDYLAVWTSMNQDGSREGVYGQSVHSDGTLVGGEFRVNTTTASQQMQPVVASDGTEQFLVIWTSFTGAASSFDLYAQRYLNANAVLLPMSAPYVYAPFSLTNNIYKPQLQVTWAPLLGISVTNFEVYVDGSATPAATVTTNQWTMTSANGLQTNSSHSFQVDYVTTGGFRSPISPGTSGTTWSGLNWGGVPYEWMAQFFGGYYSAKYTTTYWPAANSHIAGSGPTVSQVFVSGGNPLDSSTWLQQSYQHTSQGLFLSWNTQAGATYQVQVTTDLKQWNNYGAPRFAAGATDSIYVGGSPVGYYRVVLLR